MKTDLQIAQEAVMLPIKEVAASIGIMEDDLELYGKYTGFLDKKRRVLCTRILSILRKYP